MCTVHISVPNGVLWDVGQVYCGIWEFGLCCSITMECKSHCNDCGYRFCCFFFIIIPVIVLSFGAWWRHKMETFPRYRPFVRGIHQWLADSPHKGQWRRALVFPLICASTNGWVNNRDAGDLRRHRARCDVTVMLIQSYPLPVCDVSLISR